MRYVIAVTAPIGGGKTSLVNRLANTMDDATAIYCDSYERVTERSMQIENFFKFKRTEYA